MKQLQVGSLMPSLDGAEEWLDGEFDLNEYKGWAVVVQFWAVSCSFSKLNMPYVVNMLDHYRENRVVLVSVHLPRRKSDKDIPPVRQTMDELSLRGPCAIDNQRIIAERFQFGEVWPYYFMFDRSLSLRNRGTGKFGLRMIDSAIKRLLDSEADIENVDIPYANPESRDEPSRRQAVKHRSTAELFFKAGKALAGWGAAGFKLADPDVIASRLEACRKCEHLVQPPDQLIYKLSRGVSRNENQICNQCGCVVGAKAKLPNERCPAADPSNPGYNRWEQPITTSVASDRDTSNWSKQGSGLLQVLAWVIGAADTVDPKTIDTQELTDALRRHRLENLFLHRVTHHTWKSDGSLPGWCEPAMLDELLHLRRQIEKRCAAFSTLVREINRSLPSDAPLIITKGFSLYGLTGESHHLRHSNDVDVLHPEPQLVVDVCKKLGFDVELYDQLRHEYATLRLRGLAIDLHRFFPVWCYPDGMQFSAWNPREHPGIWKQSFQKRTLMEISFEEYRTNLAAGKIDERLALSSCVRDEITYDTFVKNSTFGVSSMSDIRFATPALEVLVLAAHSFKNYLHPPQRERLPIRLSTLYEIATLRGRADFDCSRFTELVEAHSGEDCVAWINAELGRVFGQEVLLPVRTKTREQFPRWICLHGGWAAPIPSADSGAVFPYRRGIVEHLGVNDIALPADQWYAVEAPEIDIPPVPRAIIQSARGEAAGFAFSLHKTTDGLTLSIRLIQPDLDSYYSIEMEGDEPLVKGRERYATIDERCTSLAFTNFSAGQLDWKDGDCYVSLHMTDTAALTNGSGTHLLTVIRWRKSAVDFIDADPVAVIPLRIR